MQLVTRSRIAALLTAAMCAVSATPLPSSSAFATNRPGETETVLPAHAFGAMVVDEVRQRVYVSAGAGASSIFAVTFDGDLVASLHGTSGASGLAIIGDTLFAAATNAGRIDAYDLTVDPPGLLRSMSTGTFASPRDLVAVSGRLWYASAGCDVSARGKVVRMNPATGVSTEFRDDVNWAGSEGLPCPILDAGGPDLLFVGDPFQGTHLYDAGALPPTHIAYASILSNDVSVRSDGSTFFVAGYYGVWELEAAAGLQQVGEWGIAAGVDGFASVDHTAKDGGLIAAGAPTSLYDIAIWDPATHLPIDVYDFRPEDGAAGVWAGGLAFAADGSHLFAVTGSANASPQLSLRVLLPRIHPSTIALSSSSSAIDYGSSATLTVNLEGGAGGSAVHVSRVTSTGQVEVASGTVDADGAFSVDVAPLKNSQYVASFEGDADWHPSTSSIVEIGVRAIVTGSMRRMQDTVGEYAIYRQDRRVYYLTEVVPPHPNHAVGIGLYRAVRHSWRHVGTVEFDQNDGGYVFIYFAPNTFKTGRYRLRSTFYADKDHLEGQSSWAYFKVVRSIARIASMRRTAAPDARRWPLVR